jgi:2-dehydro-3-deoxy-D-arabinonate dehydratase
MKLYKILQGIVIEKNAEFFLLKDEDWDLFINDDNIFDKITEILTSSKAIKRGKKIINGQLLTPIGTQELWACGVTYLRSKIGRQ